MASETCIATTKTCWLCFPSPLNFCCNPETEGTFKTAHYKHLDNSLTCFRLNLISTNMNNACLLSQCSSRNIIQIVWNHNYCLLLGVVNTAPTQRCFRSIHSWFFWWSCIIMDRSVWIYVFKIRFILLVTDAILPLSFFVILRNQMKNHFLPSTTTECGN